MNTKKQNNKAKDDLINPNNKKCNFPTYQIHGSERRKLKKELSFLKSFCNSFWRDHQMELDMGYCMMSDEDAKNMYDEKVKEKDDLEELLSRPYLPIFREERLKQILDG